jgi:hypothetical protein
MVLKYCPDKNNPVYALREQYLELLKEHGQNEIGDMPWSFDFYSNGNRIKKEHRETYRSNREFQLRITNPFETERMNKFNSCLMNKRAPAYKATNLLRKTIDTYREGGFYLVFRKVTNKLK